MPLRARDFKSLASANSAIPARNFTGHSTILFMFTRAGLRLFFPRRHSYATATRDSFAGVKVQQNWWAVEDSATSARIARLRSQPARLRPEAFSSLRSALAGFESSLNPIINCQTTQNMVGSRGLEPLTPTMSTWCANQLR